MNRSLQFSLVGISILLSGILFVTYGGIIIGCIGLTIAIIGFGLGFINPKNENTSVSGNISKPLQFSLLGIGVLLSGIVFTRVGVPVINYIGAAFLIVGFCLGFINPKSNNKDTDSNQ